MDFQSESNHEQTICLYNQYPQCIELSIHFVVLMFEDAPDRRQRSLDVLPQFHSIVLIVVDNLSEVRLGLLVGLGLPISQDLQQFGIHL